MCKQLSSNSYKNEITNQLISYKLLDIYLKVSKQIVYITDGRYRQSVKVSRD